jgi:hypothetical protein
MMLGEMRPTCVLNDSVSSHERTNVIVPKKQGFFMVNPPQKLSFLQIEEIL